MYDRFAPFYDLEYGHKDNDLHFYLESAKKYGSPVLEIGVGTGRVAIPLAKSGIQIFGIDNSSEMLKTTKRKMKNLGVNKKNIQLYHAEMKNFSLQQSFPLCIIPFRTFLHNLNLSDQMATLTCIHQHLRENGVLAFDLFVPLYNILAQKKWHDRIDEYELAEDNSGVSIDINVIHNFKNQLLTIQNVYNKERGTQKERIEMQYRYIFRHEMELLLRLCGFHTDFVFGGFENQKYNYFSGIMVFIARKKNE